MSDLGPDAKNLIALARDGDDLSAADRARHKREILARAGIAAAAGTGVAVATKSAAAKAAAAGGAAATTATAVTGASLATKVIGTLAIVSVVAGGAAGVRAMTREAPAAPSTVAPIATPTATLTLPLPSPPTSTSTSTPTPTPTSTSTSPLPSTSPSPSPSPSPHVAVTKPVQPAPIETVVAAPVPVAPQPSSSALENETRLLRGANEALQSGNAARALSLLDEHARDYPNGLLSEERAAQRVFALCAAGRVDAAREEARRFLSARPKSPLSPRVRASCGGF